MHVNDKSFRRVFSHLPTGVTVVTANGAAGPVGMAANSVVSVSLDPPLVLFCPAKSSSTWPQIRSAGAFCINVLAVHHEEVTRRFAARGAARFDGVAYDTHPAGPRLTDAVAWVACELHDEHDAGDHTIVVARVIDIEARRPVVEPLVFCRGAYGSFRQLGAG
ncbi:MAG: flavin reductase family protein [Actinobacteria bacterium]|nr:flavin reductase family protein [Actinomycetota bacterium]